MPDQKYAPLRSEEDGDVEALPPRWRRASSAASNHEVLNLRYFGIHVVVFTCGIIAGFLLRDARSPRASGIDQMAQYSMVPSPAFEAIASKPLVLTPHELEGHGHPSPYQGYPTPERTALWMEMMQGYSIRVPSTSLDALDLHSIPLNDDSGDAWVSMNVYHHLHCLDSIRHQIAGVQCSTTEDHVNHTGHYDTGDADEPWFPPHIDHCIETLRKRLICQPDLGVRAIAWKEGQPGVAFANNTVDSACVNWDAVQDWTRAHSFTEEEELITTPEGKLYPGPRTPPARCGE